MIHQVIKVADGSAFTTFEGAAVGANTGYLKLIKKLFLMKQFLK